MINLKYIKNQKFSEIRLVEVLFYSFPLWFIVGNFAVSLNTLIFIAAGLLLIKKEQLAIRFNNSYWLLIAFFLYFFISTTIQFQKPGILNDVIQDWPLENNPIFKSFFLVRFLILIFIIDTLFFNKILNLRKLFLSSLICTSFVSLDILLQYINGFDLFGYKREGSWNMGPFGDEWIAGGYLKNFSFFSFFYFFDNFKNKKYGTLLLIFLLVLHLVAIFFSGNKMSFILFLLGYFLIILLVKQIRFSMLIGLCIFIPIFLLVVNNDNYYKASYKSFVSEINITKLFKNNKNNLVSQETEKMEVGKNNQVSEVPKEIVLLRHSAYNRVFQTALTMWKMQPFFGFGLKSFRIKCWDMLAKDNIKREANQKPQTLVCANHAHNYYLELLSEAGIIGVSLIIIFFLILLKSSFIYLKNYTRHKNLEINFLIPIIILFFLEIWPIKSTGSFFTTWGATFFWLNTAILITKTTKKINQN